MGAKNAPVYRIVVTDSRNPRDGRFIEEIGTYNPIQKGVNYSIDLDRTNHWIKCGAQPSDTVKSFIRKAKAALAAEKAAN